MSGWPEAGGRVCYSPPIEGATGGGSCRPAVIAALGEYPDDIFADLQSLSGDPIVTNAMRYECGPGYWGADDFESYCGGTWHARCKVKRAA